MNDLVKNAIKGIKLLKNGYLERDYSYLAKPSFVKSNNLNARLNLVISCIDKNKMYGGLTTAINLFFYLCRTLKYEMRILVTEQKVTEGVLKQYPGFILENADADSSSGKSICNVQVNCGSREKIAIRKNDIIMTTYWSTQYIMSDVIASQKRMFSVNHPIIYLIQDFEPGFYPWSSEYFLCESTYKEDNVVAIFNSENLENYVLRQGYQFRHHISFAPKLNETLLRHIGQTEKLNRKNQIIVYGRPHVPRNCFSIIVEALKKFTEKYEFAAEWQYLSIGSKHSDVKLSKGCVLKSYGKLSLEEYARTLATAKIGISLMCSPHPSYPPLEMAAYGVTVVTNSFFCKDLSMFSPNIVSLNVVNFDTVAQALIDIIKNGKVHTNMEENNKYMKTDEQFYEVGEYIKKIYENI